MIIHGEGAASTHPAASGCKARNSRDTHAKRLRVLETFLKQASNAIWLVSWQSKWVSSKGFLFRNSNLTIPNDHFQWFDFVKYTREPLRPKLSHGCASSIVPDDDNHKIQIIRLVGQGAGREPTFLWYLCYGRTVDWQCTSDDHLLISIEKTRSGINIKHNHVIKIIEKQNQCLGCIPNKKAAKLAEVFGRVGSCCMITLAWFTFDLGE